MKKKFQEASYIAFELGTFQVESKNSNSHNEMIKIIIVIGWMFQHKTIIIIFQNKKK